LAAVEAARTTYTRMASSGIATIAISAARMTRADRGLGPPPTSDPAISIWGVVIADPAVERET
jgi:hypothetical protein